jgi:hypothetical protein
MEKEVTDPNKNQNTLEFAKIQGFDVLEKLPEEEKLSSYNEEFYTTLSNLKFLSCTIPQDDILFYHFETNKNASLTSSTAQCQVTIKELMEVNKEIDGDIEIIREKVNKLRERVETKSDEDTCANLRPEIERLDMELRKFLIEQKTKNFQLIKEIAILKKEKDELYNQIQICVERLNKVEIDVGKNCKKNKNKKKNIVINPNNKSMLENSKMNSTTSDKIGKVNTIKV